MTTLQRNHLESDLIERPLRPTVIRAPRNPDGLFGGWGVRF